MLREDGTIGKVNKMWGDIGPHEWMRLPMFYLAAYAVMRFCMELMRGDHTDHIGVFTPSQTIALFVMLPAAAIVFYFAGRNPSHEPDPGK